MNKKKIIISIVILLVLLCIGGGVYYFFTRQDKNSTLTVLENQWIEDNKNNVIDLSIITDLPVFSYEGTGLVFDFITDLETDTGLAFNKLSYNADTSATSDYAFTLTAKKADEDILIYEDNYAILTKDNIKYVTLEDINVMTLGVLDEDLEKANEYLKDNGGISFKTYNSVSTMSSGLANDEVQGIVLPRMMYLNYIIANDELNVAYNITEMTSDLVLHLGDNKKLNTILEKYYTKWSNENFDTIFNKYFSDNYFTFREIYENKKVEFRGKRYAYGFVPNAPFDALKNGSLVGVNSEIIKDFAKMADIEIEYKEYKNLASLIAAFNDSDIDFFLNTSANTNYSVDTYETVNVYDDDVVVLSNIDNNLTINSVSSLVSKTVYTIEDSKIVSSLSNYDINLKTYDNIDDLVNNISKDSIIVLDSSIYNIYLHSSLKNYKVDYMYNLENGYSYINRSANENEVFNNFFNFYLSFINDNYYKNRVNYKSFNITVKSYTYLYVIIGFLVVAVAGCLFMIIRKPKSKKKLKGVSKENKLKYIDMLTSLKNRNFLNDSISEWDKSEVYPQTIVIIDLNNVAYINDNYGHEEGDKVIVETANILINNQKENSEIIRTDGNEFLIYMVAYDEKEVVAYIRKLTKELKEISHGFGAAVGYSMINDAIKTIDDAINEASLDMRSNKEETQN